MYEQHISLNNYKLETKVELLKANTLEAINVCVIYFPQYRVPTLLYFDWTGTGKKTRWYIKGY